MRWFLSAHLSYRFSVLALAAQLFVPVLDHADGVLAAHLSYRLAWDKTLSIGRYVTLNI
jgi:hypothetical protein